MSLSLNDNVSGYTFFRFKALESLQGEGEEAWQIETAWGSHGNMEAGTGLEPRDVKDW